MSRIPTILVCLALLATLTLPGAAEDEAGPTENPFLWQIEGDTPVFFFGTIHLPDDRVLNLPAVVREALDGSDAVYIEIPMDGETQSQLARKMMMPAGKTLKTVLPEDLYTRADKYLKGKGYSMAIFESFKVWAFSAFIGMVEYLGQMQTKPALDAKLYLDAKKAGKTVGGLETAEEQIACFEAFSQEEHIAMLRDTLDHLEKEQAAGKAGSEKLVQAYLKGDGAGLLALMTEYMKPDDPATAKFNKVFLTDRNNNMVERALKKVAAAPDQVHFFAVGALHYPGDDGIIKLLEAKGHEVRRLSAKDAGKLFPEKAEAK